MIWEEEAERCGELYTAFFLSLATKRARENVVRGRDRDTDKGIFKIGRTCTRRTEEMKVLEREKVVGNSSRRQG